MHSALLGLKSFLGKYGQPEKPYHTFQGWCRLQTGKLYFITAGMGGGYISSVGAIASRDGQHILTAAACSIRIYSTATAALVAELTGHTGDVTALVLHPHSSNKARCPLLPPHTSAAAVDLLDLLACNAT